MNSLKLLLVNFNNKKQHFLIYNKYYFLKPKYLFIYKK